MAILVTVETLVLGLLALLVAGLLRSHAEILRRLAEVEVSGSGMASVLPEPRLGRTNAPDIVGTSPAGDPIKVAVTATQPGTLLAFLSSGCDSCRSLWDGLGRPEAELPFNVRLVVVTRGRDRESPTRIRDLAAPGATVVMSSPAWDDYAVTGSPYFIFVDGRSGAIHSEGSARSWTQVSSLLRDALADQPTGQVPVVEGAAASDNSPERIRRADQELAAAGIAPGDPSLWRLPGSPAREEDHA
jgi:hypothetical protein